jgi:catechol 2,3-dioxygenase-like lactoylglutathione lyase family enzyme
VSNGPKVHHIGIVVDDVDEAVDFLTETLGLEVRMRVELAEGRGAFLKCGNIDIEVVQYLEEGRQAAALQNAPARIEHICFHTDDADSSYAGLTAKGVEVVAPPKDWKGRKSFFTKPETCDGVMYQFRQPTDGG